MENNEIKITHFVNPHFFFFTWVRDEGFNEELKVLEDKITNIARVNAADMKADDSTVTGTKLGDMVGVFLPNWNKWIRASIKKKDGEGSTERFGVWAIDYGYPLVSKASHIIKLPASFKGMFLKSNNIFTGGIENIMPTGIRYDIALATSVKERLSNWSPDAIELTQNILQRAVKVEFENVHEYKPKKSHFFGRLMVQRPDGQRMDIVKCLWDMNMAAFAESGFAEEVKTSETLQQRHWLSVNGDMLNLNFVVSPVAIAKDETGYTDKEFFDDESEIDDEEVMPDAVDEQFFNESVSVFQPQFQPKNTSPINGANESQNVSNGPAPTSNVLPSKNDSTEFKSKADTEKQSDSSVPKDSSNKNGQGEDIQRANRFRRYNRLKNNFRRDPNLADNQNSQRPQQFQIQRATVSNQQNTQPTQQNQFNQRPPNSFNSYKNQFNPPAHFNQPTGQFNQQQGRRSVGGYVPSNLRPNFRNNRNRNVVSNNQFGDPEFHAALAHPQLSRITEHVPMTNGPMNLPYHLPIQPFLRPGHGHGPNYGQNFDKNQRNQPNDRQNNRQNARYVPKNQTKNAGPEKNRNNAKKPTEKVDANSDAASTSTVKTDSTKIECKVQRMNIKSEAAENGANSSAECKSYAAEENAAVKTEPKQENTDE
ncbi:suppressor of Mek1-like [Sitodiplosis mosellana]|uniref:suppressor of Mek1-like n=1 Tax=Sitodiplosis mosellana TaxID=263140 RepID=UPI0024442AB1|nr:suppressor of Mek1-like [Sitodiplosis mosellana]